MYCELRVYVVRDFEMADVGKESGKDCVRVFDLAAGNWTKLWQSRKQFKEALLEVKAILHHL